MNETKIAAKESRFPDVVLAATLLPFDLIETLDSKARFKGELLAQQIIVLRDYSFESLQFHPLLALGGYF